MGDLSDEQRAELHELADYYARSVFSMFAQRDYVLPSMFLGFIAADMRLLAEHVAKHRADELDRLREQVLVREELVGQGYDVPFDTCTYEQWAEFRTGWPTVQRCVWRSSLGETREAEQLFSDTVELIWRPIVSLRGRESNGH